MTDDEWIEMEMWRMGAKFSRASCIVTGIKPVLEMWRNMWVEGKDGNHTPAPPAEGVVK